MSRCQNTNHGWFSHLTCLSFFPALLSNEFLALPRVGRIVIHQRLIVPNEGRYIMLGYPSFQSGGRIANLLASTPTKA